MRRKIVSSFDLLFFSERISGVMNGFWIFAVQVMVLSGACLSRRLDKVDENNSAYCGNEVGVDA